MIILVFNAEVGNIFSGENKWNSADDFHDLITIYKLLEVLEFDQ